MQELLRKRRKMNKLFLSLVLVGTISANILANPQEIKPKKQILIKTKIGLEFVKEEEAIREYQLLLKNRKDDDRLFALVLALGLRAPFRKHCTGEGVLGICHPWDDDLD